MFAWVFLHFFKEVIYIPLKGHAWYVQPTDCKKFNKKKGTRVDASIPLRSGDRIIMGGRGSKGPGREAKEKKKEARSGMWETGDKHRWPEI